MAITSRLNESFFEYVMPSDALDQAIDWIRANLSPEDVFTVNELEEWAYENGYFEEKEQS